eukprot:c26465_g1_i3 orf=1577-4720(+)
MFLSVQVSCVFKHDYMLTSVGVNISCMQILLLRYSCLHLFPGDNVPILERLSFVKDFFPQSRFSRATMAEEEEGDTVPQTTRLETTIAGTDEGVPSRNRKGQYRNRIKRLQNQKAAFAENQQDGTAEMGFLNARQGKMFTVPSNDGNSWGLSWANVSLFNEGRKLLIQRSQITSIFGAEKLWTKGYTGAGVKMAIFDTGVRADHPHFRNIKERTNWTNEDTLNDNLGHGTFVAGVIASQDPQCLGFAPDAEIYAFRVFTDAQVSYTSWFLDAFNYAIAKKINILNLSIGGPDYLDRPFVEKVWEMTANNIIMVSAIGNDGPLYGTLNNPADQSDVIGVGGIDYNDHIASFSSRGMSTWEIPHGYGRLKPDIVAYGRDIIGSKISTGCKSLSGTSVASPVVAGAVCLLASVIPERNRWDVINPASMKQALVEGAARLNGPNMFEQGAGRLDLLESFEILVNYKPRASVIPQSLDFIDCPYFWPFCLQPIYAGAMPVIFNATILNGLGVVGYIEDSPLWLPSDEDGNLLDLRFTFSDVIWPWTGFLGLHMQVRDEGANFEGVIEGNVNFTVVSPPGRGELYSRRSKCTIHVRVKVIPTPIRQKRILWDQFHNVKYPPGYIPRDSLDVRNDILDWHGDHPHTNYHSMFDMLRGAGYFLETLGSPLTCFDARQYGSLLMVDLEDEYHKEEIEKIEHDVKYHGLGLIVFADWYHVETMVKMKFFDDNTRSWWTPVTGGANIPALNELLHPFGIAFSDMILNGPYSVGGERGFYASGTAIAKFPAGGFVHRSIFQDNTRMNSGPILQASIRAEVEAAVLGAVDMGNGRIAVYGDSNCLDSSHMVINCYWLLKKLLEFTSQNIRDSVIFSSPKKLTFPLIEHNIHLPTRRDDVNFSMYSLVLERKLQCKSDARFEVLGSRGYSVGYSDSLYSIYPQRQPMGNDAHDHRILSSLPTATNSSSFSFLQTTNIGHEGNFGLTPKGVEKDDRLAKSAVQARGGSNAVTSFVDENVTEWKMVERNSDNTDHKKKLDLSLAAIGWLNRDELDPQTLLAEP